MGFKLFLVAFCAIQLASCATVDEEYQAYLNQYKSLTETLAEYQAIVTDDFAAFKERAFIGIETKINQTNEWMASLQDEGSAGWGEPGLKCVNEHISDMEQVSERLYNFAVEYFDNAQIIANIVNLVCVNVAEESETKHASIEVDWWLCVNDDIPCKTEVVKNANEFIGELNENLASLHEDAVDLFQNSVIPQLTEDIQAEYDYHTDFYVNVLSEVRECWNAIA